MSPLAPVDPYLVRDVLWCRDCRESMAPAEWRRTRVYRCEGCDGGAGRRVDAQLVESEVWDRLVGRYPGLRAVTGQRDRHRNLRRHVIRVEVARPYPMRVSWSTAAGRALTAVS